VAGDSRPDEGKPHISSNAILPSAYFFQTYQT
jgi:hypothetical protein